MRIFGHPLHPFLVHFPVAFWTLGSVCDGCALAGFTQTWPYGWLLLILGLMFAIPAMTAGFMDLADLEEDASRDGNRHMTLMAMAWIVYLCALLTRFDGKVPLPDPQIQSISLSIFGFVLMMAGGWYGGRLVYHHRAGVRRHD